MNAFQRKDPAYTTHRAKGYLTEVPGFTLRADFTRVSTVNGIHWISSRINLLSCQRGIWMRAGILLFQEILK